MQQGLAATLKEEKPTKIKNSEWKSIKRKATITNRLALTPIVKYTMLNGQHQNTCGKKLEEIYASRSLTNHLC